MTLGISKFLRGKSHIVFFTCNTEKTIKSKQQTKGCKELLDGIGYAYSLYCDAVKGVCGIFKFIKLYTLNMCGSLYPNFCCSVTHSDQVFVTLWTAAHQLQLPCPSLSPGVCLNSCPLIQWWYPTISSSTALFSFCLQFFPENFFLNTNYISINLIRKMVSSYAKLLKKQFCQLKVFIFMFLSLFYFF